LTERAVVLVALVLAALVAAATVHLLENAQERRRIPRRSIGGVVSAEEPSQAAAQEIKKVRSFRKTQGRLAA
jgi:hypothetical protein